MVSSSCNHTDLTRLERGRGKGKMTCGCHVNKGFASYVEQLERRDPIREIQLMNCAIDVDQVRSMIALLAGHTWHHLEGIYVGSNAIGDEGMVMLLSFLTHFREGFPRLMALNMNRTGVSARVLPSLLSFLKCTQADTFSVYLYGNEFDPVQWSQFESQVASLATVRLYYQLQQVSLQPTPRRVQPLDF